MSEGMVPVKPLRNKSMNKVRDLGVLARSCSVPFMEAILVGEAATGAGTSDLKSAACGGMS